MTESRDRPASFATPDTSWKSGMGNYLVLLVVLAILIGLFSLLSEHFFSILTFRTLANQIPPLVVVAVGMTFVLAIAGIDLSVGSVLALGSAVLGVLLVDSGWSLWMSVPSGAAR